MLSQSSPVPLGRPRKPHAKRPLAILLREHGVFSTAHAADLALDICDALCTVHANDVVHGQLGLRCVRLTMTRERGPQDLDIFTLTEPEDGEIAARAAPLLAPEQRDLSRPIDGRADIWAIGALLYLTIVGKPLPLHGLVEIAEGAMPASLAAIVLACLALDPAKRPQDVDELTEKLGSFATWPPDRFARLAERRDKRASAERARLALAARGLQHMPAVLDRLDDAAVVRAQRETTPKTATMSSILERPTTTAALDRLMAVVHQGTEAARVELAADLPALVDFDDEDEEVLEATVATEPLVRGPVASPLETVPLYLAQPTPVFQPPAPGPVAGAASRPIGPLVGLAAAAFVVSLALGYLGFRLSATPTATTPAPVEVVIAPRAPPPPLAAAAPAPNPPEIPVFVPSALPEVAPVSPASLPDAKR